MNIKLFTHNDLDGVSCAIVTKRVFFNCTVDVEYCSYNNINKRVNSYLEKEEFHDLIFITDISVNKETADNINKLIENNDKIFLRLIDHHKSEIWLNEYDWAHITVEYLNGSIASATDLLYNYFISNDFADKQISLEKYVEHVRQYDTWEWFNRYNNIHAKEMNDLLYIIGVNKFVDRFVNDISIEFTCSERLILDIEQKKIEKYIEKKHKELIIKKLNDFTVGVVFAEQYHSELGNKLALDNSDLDFVVILNIGASKVSYRSVKNDIDLGQIAKTFGGGGHPKSAGSEFSEDIKEDIFNLIFNNKN